MQTHYLFSRVRTNVDIDNKGCTITLYDSGVICSHIWKGTISRENVHLGMIHVVNVENLVLSTSCRSYHECICTYIYNCKYIYTYHDLVESQCSPRQQIRCPIPTNLPCKTGLLSALVYRPYLFQGRSILTKQKLSPDRDIQKMSVSVNVYISYIVCIWYAWKVKLYK